jgi:hypothetical protein
MNPVFYLACGIVLAPSAALAQKAQQQRPQALTRVLDCRAIQQSQERLACFDQSVAALEAAETSRTLVVLDRQQVQNTRRTLFGLTLPSLDLFGPRGEKDESLAEIETTIRAASQNSLGKWIFTLQDGARWVQTDTRDLPAYPKSGQTIKIRRAAMGSFLANVNGQVAIRVQRER